MDRSWRPLFSPVFLVGIIAYAYVRMGRMGWFNTPQILNDYLSDLVCMPIILTLCLVGLRIFKGIPHFELNWLMVLSMTTFYAVLFEWVLPAQSTNYTADLVDVLVYFVGAVCFYYFQGELGFQDKAEESYQ